MKLLLLFLALVSVAFGEQKERDISPLITGCTWKYDHSTKLGVTLKFYKDSKAVSGSGWAAIWRRIDERTVELTMKDKRGATVTFDEKFKTFSATFFDGEKIAGKRLGDVPASL